MPKESLSVYLTAVDGMSPVLASITDKTKALDKESQELRQTFENLQKANKGLIERKTELQKQLQAVNEEVKEARKSFQQLGDEASSDALNKATEKQQALRNQIAGTTKALQENQKIYKENIETVRKGGADGGLSGMQLAMGLVSSQIGQMATDSLGGFVNYLAESSLGIPTASLLTNGINSAISGGLAGFSIAGAPGAALGATAGLVSGLVSGETEILKAKDDVYKDYYGGLYETVKARSDETVETGSTIAGGREQTRMAFSRRLGGDELADAYLSRVEDMAAETNYDYDEIVGYAKLLLNSYEPDEVLGVLRDLSDATAGLDLSSSDVNMMISGLSRMRTTGKATQEYLNYFRERGVDTDQALADSLGLEKSAVAGQIKDGKVGGEQAAEAILEYIEKTFGGLSEGLAGTYDAMTDNLGDILSTIQASGGAAYNELRKEGIGAQMTAYEGELGDAIKEINAVIGENRARKENLQDQYMREVLEAVLGGARGELWGELTEDQQNTLAEMNASYTQWKEAYEASGRTDAEAAAQMEALYETAQTLGQAYFDESELVKTLNDTELEEVEAIREATRGLGAATDATYALTQALSKGRGLAGLGVGLERSITESVNSGNASHRARMGGVELSSINSHAFGLDRVPYDGYPSLLHEGERVLTAAEARAQDAAPAAAPIQITVTGNSFTGTPEEMADTLAEILVRKLTQAAIAAAPQ